MAISDYHAGIPKRRILMAWIKRLVVLLLLLAIGFLGWSWQMGPLRIKRDISQFAKNMESCTAFNQDFKDAFSGKTMHRAVTGPAADDTCGVVMDTYAPQVLSCAFAMEDMPNLAAAFATQAKNIGFFGRISMRVDTQNPDPWQRAMNSPACALKDR